MQISSSTGASWPSVPAQAPAASGTNAAGQVQPTPADSSQPSALALSSKPSQLSASLMLDMLNSANGAGGFDALSSSAKSDLDWGVAVPPGAAVAVQGVLQQGVAQDITSAIGENGQVSLSEVDSMLGITESSDPNAPAAAIAEDWQKLVGSSTATMSTGQLTTAIQSFLKAQGIESADMTPNSSMSMIA